MAQPKLGWEEVKPTDFSARSMAHQIKVASSTCGPLFDVLGDDALSVHLQIMEGGLRMRFKHKAIINSQVLPSLACSTFSFSSVSNEGREMGAWWVIGAGEQRRCVGR